MFESWRDQIPFDWVTDGRFSFGVYHNWGLPAEDQRAVLVNTQEILRLLGLEPWPRTTLMVLPNDEDDTRISFFGREGDKNRGVVVQFSRGKAQILSNPLFAGSIIADLTTPALIAMRMADRHGSDRPSDFFSGAERAYMAAIYRLVGFRL